MVQNYFATHLAPVWQSLREGTQTALLAGLAVGVALIVALTLFPGEPFDYGAGDTGNSEQLKKYLADYNKACATGEKVPAMPPVEVVKADEPEKPEKPLVIDEARLAEKAQQAQKLFGITAQQYTDAVIQATAEANAGVAGDGDAPDFGGGSSILSLLPFLLGAGVLVAFVRSQRAPAGPPPSFAAFLVRAFPREARAFGWVDGGAVPRLAPTVVPAMVPSVASPGGEL